MAPDRPSDPRSYVPAQNDLLRRMRELERNVVRLPDGADPLQTFESGLPLGDTRFLDFGAGIQATLIGNDYVRISGAQGQLEFDAIVDFSISATDTTARIFKGIGECLTWLYDNVSTARAAVFVRGTAPSPGYTETGNWRNGQQVLLFGAPDQTTRGINTGRNFPLWNHAGFGSTTGGGFFLTNMHTEFGAKALGFGRTTADDLFYANNCEFSSNSMTGTPRLCDHDNAWFSNCWSSNTLQFGVNVYLDHLVITGVGRNATLASSKLFGSIDSFAPSRGAVTLTLPAYADIAVHDPIGGSGVITINGGATWCRLRGGSTLMRVNVGSGADYDIEGVWASIIVGAASGVGGGRIRARIDASSTDITGPCILDLTGIRRTVTLRGTGLAGVLSARVDANLGAGNNLLDYINCDGSAIVASLNGGGFTGKPYNFDAASTKNVLVLEDAATFSAAGTDAGTGNRVLPEGASPFTINGHVIEDEGGALTQRANMNFVGAGVTATDAGGKTVVTIPGGGGSVLYDNPVESQSGDVMAQGVDTDVSRADHRHSRRGDEILRLTRML